MNYSQLKTGLNGVDLPNGRIATEEEEDCYNIVHFRHTLYLHTTKDISHCKLQS